MNENHAKKVEQAFAARLSLILTGSGFRTDIGSRVFRGRRKIDPDQIPCVVIVGGDDTITAQKRGEVLLDQRYIIEAHCTCDPDNPNDAALDMIADIKRVMWGKEEDKSFGGLVKDLNYSGRIISPREDGSSLVAAGVELTASFSETLGDQ